jgi:hypothetical protein
MTPVNKIMLKTDEKELIWKMKDGSLKPISELTDDELIKFRKICLKKNEMHYYLYEKFTNFVEQFDEVLKQRIEEKKLALQKLEIADKD